MIIGISALLFNMKEALDLCENITEIKHIELGIDNLNECTKLYKYKDRIEKLGLSLSIHLPMELNTCENIEYIRKSWINFTKNVSNNLTDFDIKYFNFHLGYVISNRLNRNKEKYLNNSIEFLKELCEEINYEITIENVYSNGGDFSNVGNTVYDFEYIFKVVRNNNIGFCYDTGHYLINKDNYVDSLKDNIKVIHLSDNDGIEDIHIGIGKGILQRKHIKEVLKIDAKYLILEINYEHIKETINKLNAIMGEV